MYFCIVSVIHHSEGIGSGFLGVCFWLYRFLNFFLRFLLIFFGCLLTFFRSDREAERSNILVRFSTAKFTPSLLQWHLSLYAPSIYLSLPLSVYLVRIIDSANMWWSVNHQINMVTCTQLSPYSLFSLSHTALGLGHAVVSIWPCCIGQNGCSIRHHSANDIFCLHQVCV
jgi:hypothetical protein